MSLELPADVEPFLTDDYDQLHSAAVYALRLSRPDDITTAWDREFDSRPPYFEALRDSREVIYVGASNDVLSRLEDHRDKEVRIGALMRVCEIQSLRNVWFFDDSDKAFERESGIAMMMNNELDDDVFVHQR